MFSIISWIGFFFYIPYVHGQPINFTLDFENGSLKGWTQIGNAFLYQPTLDDNPTARERGQPSGHQGMYWIGTHEKYQGRPGQERGDIQGDEPTGTLTSGRFTIPSGTLSFLVGGGRSFQTRVELVIIGGTGEFDQERTLYASGRDTETMHRVTWNLTPHAGKTGQIRIVDASSGTWGHINADDFRFTKEPQSDTFHLDLRLTSNPPFFVGQPIRFTVKPEPAHPDLLYQFRFGDDGLSESTSQPLTDHAYESEGTYYVMAVARIGEGIVARSNTVILEVLGVYVKHTVSLEVDENRVEQGHEVRFTAFLAPDIEGAEYRFEFGDGEMRNWADEAVAEHIYSQSGTYHAHVIARRDHEILSESNAVVVEIGAPSPDRVIVPNVVGRDTAQASEIFREARLQVGEIVREYADFPVGIIAEQDPRAGDTISIGSSVNLLVSLGQEMVVVPNGVVVPNVVGRRIEEAKEILERARLRVGRLGERISDSDPGIVLRQSPKAGARVPAGTPVNLVLPAQKPMPVPWIIGGLITALTVGSYLFLRIRRWRKTGECIKSTMRLRSKEDIGTQRVESDRPIQSDFGVRLKPVSDRGTQEIEAEGSLIIDEGREHE